MSFDEERRPADGATDPEARDREFADVVGGLRRLAERLDETAYPGLAWPVKRVARRRPSIFRRVIPAAAAAAMLIAAGAAYRFYPRAEPRPQPQPKIAATAPAAKQATEAATTVGARIDPSVASYITWRMPRPRETPFRMSGEPAPPMQTQ